MSSGVSDSNNKIYELRVSYAEKKDLIRSRLDEFREVFEKGDDRRIFEELAFCILTSAVGPKMAIKGVNAIKHVLSDGNEGELQLRLRDEHRYPDRARYIVDTREYLKRECNFELKRLILSFENPTHRRDFFASNRDIRGIGYLQASHFLRNIGFFGYAILDKNVISSLYEFGAIDSTKAPTTRNKYIDLENRMRRFAETIEISIDELDLLLWSRRTGQIPK